MAARGSALGLALLLAGCGGGGGGVATVPVPPAAVTPTPAPAPAPAPAPSSFDTAEYRRSAAAQVQALAAYDRGISGNGIIAAVIDSGVNPALAEFAGRIATASRDVAADRPLLDERGHGTSVAGILLAARNNSGMHGIAPQATLLALRADTPGSCTDEGCSYGSAALTAGFDAAVAAGARVINVSLGGEGTAQSTRLAAARAGGAGVVTVLSAGNEALASPQGFANQLVAVAPATTIVVGAVDAAGAMADFSNRAGTLAANYLVAPGVSVRSFNQDGAAFFYSGTSVAAPVVSGAAALLAQGFPMLTGAQIVDILLRTADDLGAPGTDAVFGRGLLNITRAFAPVGGLGSGGVPISFGGVLGGPLGDGGPLRNALAAVPVLDGYGRPYVADLAGSIASAPRGRLAARLLAQPVEQAVAAAGAGVAAFALNGDSRSLWAGDRATMAALAPGAGPGSISGHVLLALAGGQRLAAGQGQAVATLLALADPGGGPAPGAASAITGDPAQLPGSRPLGALALALPLPTPLGRVTLAAAFGQSLLPAERSAGAALAGGLATTAMLRLSRQLGPLQLAGELRFDAEQGSAAGTRLAPGFGLAGALTSSIGLHSRLALGRLELAGDWRRAHSRLRLDNRPSAGLIRASDGLSGTAASISAQMHGLARAGDSLRLVASRPLALAGSLELAGFATPVAAGPAAREAALELGYALPIAAGARLQFSLFHRDNPGHVAASPADDGAAVQLGWRW